MPVAAAQGGPPVQGDALPTQQCDAPDAPCSPVAFDTIFGVIDALRHRLGLPAESTCLPSALAAAAGGNTHRSCSPSEWCSTAASPNGMSLQQQQQHAGRAAPHRAPAESVGVTTPCSRHNSITHSEAADTGNATNAAPSAYTVPPLVGLHCISRGDPQRNAAAAVSLSGNHAQQHPICGLTSRGLYASSISTGRASQAGPVTAAGGAVGYPGWASSSCFAGLGGGGGAGATTPCTTPCPSHRAEEYFRRTLSAVRGPPAVGGIASARGVGVAQLQLQPAAPPSPAASLSSCTPSPQASARDAAPSPPPDAALLSAALRSLEGAAQCLYEAGVHGRDLVTALEESRAACSALQEELEEVRDSVGAFDSRQAESRNRALHLRNAELRVELQDAAARQREAEDEILQGRTYAASLQDKLDDALSVKKQVSLAYAGAVQKLHSAGEARRDSSHPEVASLQSERSDLQHRVAELTADLAVTSSRCDSLEEEVEELTGTLARLREASRRATEQHCAASKESYRLSREEQEEEGCLKCESLRQRHREAESVFAETLRRLDEELSCERAATCIELAGWRARCDSLARRARQRKGKREWGGGGGGDGSGSQASFGSSVAQGLFELCGWAPADGKPMPPGVAAHSSS